MSTQPSLLARDAPTIDQQRLRAQTGVDKPVATPSLWEQFNTTAENAAGYSELHQTERDNALESAYDGVIADLAKRGVDTRSMGWSPLPYSRKIYNPDAIWQAVATARAQDPKAFSDLPPDLTAFQRRMTAPIDAKYADREQVEQKSGWVPWLAGQFLGGASDPINQVGMLSGAGEAKTFLGGVLNSAKTNAYLTAVTEPAKMLDRAAMGERTSPGEVLGDIGSSAAIGAGLHIGMHGLGKLGESVWGKTALAAHDEIGPDRMTATERAASDMLHAADETAAISPYQPGPGTDTHFARMDAAARALDAPPGLAVQSAPPLGAPPRFDDQSYAARVSAAESGGSYSAQAEGSSAFGMYQITRPTWLRLTAGDPLFGGLSDDAKWNMRTNPALQERLFKRLVGQQRETLARIGVPETYGNMYLLHFAGEGGGAKILRAPPETPIGELLSARAIEANPFLKGKTAGDVVAWAHARMKDPEHPGALIRRDVFDEGRAGDEAWAAAQRASDDAEHAFELAQRDAEAARLPPSGDIRQDDFGDPDSWRSDPAFAPSDQTAAPVGTDWEPDVEAGAQRMADAAEVRQRWNDALDQLRFDREGEAAAVLHHPEIGPIDVKWGEAGDAANGFKGGYGLSHIIAKHPEMESVLQDLPAIIQNMTVKQRRPERTVLQSADHEASIALTWHGDDQRWLVTAYERKTTPAGPTSVREPMDGGSVSPRPEADADIERLPMARNDAPVSRETLEDVSRGLGDRGEATNAVEGFDHPDDIAAERQTASLEHDLRQLAEAEPDAQVQIDDAGAARSIGEILADLDADEAAIAAAKGCL